MWVTMLVGYSISAMSADNFLIKTDMGRMTTFYRYQPALTEWTYMTPKNIQMPIPAFMTDKRISFPYKKRPYDKEILFCDNVNVVRFLEDGVLQEKDKMLLK